MDESELIFELLVGLALTFLMYEAYPFFRVIIMGKKYNKEEAKKMALWNSIVLGSLSFIITASIDPSAKWTGGACILYYFINKSLWVSKKAKNSASKDDKKKNNKEESLLFECDRCGAKFKADLDRCPKCGADFVDDEDINNDEYLFMCDKCGAKVKNSDKKCPSCGAKFEDDDNDKTLTDKYDDLIKLKELLDKKIITQDEFDKEKKKVLNK